MAKPRFFRVTYSDANQDAYDAAIADDYVVIGAYSTRRQLKGDLLWDYDHADPVRGLTPRTIATAARKAWQWGVSETPFGDDGVLCIVECKRAEYDAQFKTEA